MNPLPPATTTPATAGRPLDTDGCGQGRKCQRLQGEVEGWGRTRAPPSAGAAHAVLLTSVSMFHVTPTSRGHPCHQTGGGELEDERDCGEGMGTLFKVHMLLCEWDMSS